MFLPTKQGKIFYVLLKYSYGEDARGEVGQSAFDVREELIKTYQNDRKSYFLEENVKSKRNEDAGTPHRGLEAFIPTDLNF
jgi:hypothetical protein